MARFALFARDRSGSVAIFSALSGVLLVGFTTVAIDGANFYLAKRRQQAATDLAAMAGAGGLDQATGRASAVMAANGFGTAALNVSVGTYAADATRTPDARFSAGSAGNAVRVVSTSVQPLIFGGALQSLLGAGRGPAGVSIRAQATARKQDVAAFTLGSGVAALDGGLLNAVLGSLLGAKLSLSLLDYQALAAANIDVFDYADALATRLRLTGPTYGSLAAGATSQSALFASMADALAANPAAAAAVRAIATALPAAATASLAPVVDFGPAAGLVVGSPHPAAARVSALDLVSALVRLCGNGRLATVDFGTTLPGLGSTQMLLAIGEPMQGASFSAVGSEGATLRTAQVRLQLVTQVGGLGLPAAMTLPLYIDMAPASATIATIACSNPQQPAVTLNVATGLARAAIGTAAPADMVAFGANPVVAAAPLIDVANLLRVTASAQTSLSGSGSVPVSFATAEIKARTPKTVSAQPSLAALLGGLAANTRLSITILGLAPPQPALSASVTSAIAATMTPLDAALERLLPILGITVGNATTTVTGVRCGQGVLVD